ncbi:MULTISPECIES: histidine phosphatase family protein [Nocardia]|uniref:histidine phosphatase family protein n=1 Tax=Nocardia abscessus TaxID=120957 RepID=UPI0024590D25|nr:histidine phosphatase family protein [Nocardia abscessus]
MDRCDGGSRAGVRLLLIRCAHGETHGAGVAEGEETDRGLSATGRSQAARLGERLAAEQSSLQVSRVYSTDVRRAAQTATIVAELLGLSVETNPLGPAHGKPVERAMSGGEGGQPWGQWAPRVGRELELIAGRHPGETVVVVCHQSTVLAAAQYFLEGTYSRAHASIEVDHTAITEWHLRPDRHQSAEAEGSRWVLVRANDAEHLRAQPHRITRRKRPS